MLKEFKIFLKIQNLLLENSSLSLNESTEIANFIIDVIKEYNIKNNKNLKIKDNIENIQKVDIGEQENTLTIEKNGKRQQIKIGKLLRQIIENINDKDLENLVNLIKLKIIEKGDINFSNYEFIIDNNIIKWYKYFEETQNFKSCMTKKHITESKILDLYKYDNNIKILIVKQKNKIVGRCLLWNNLNIGKGIDKIYSSSPVYIKVIHLWAEKNGYKNIFEVNDTITYQIPKNIWEKLEFLPYFDSLEYFNENGLLCNKKTKECYISSHNKNGNDLREIFIYKDWFKYFDTLNEIKEWSKYFKKPVIAKLGQRFFESAEEAYKWYKIFHNIKKSYKWFVYFNSPEEAYKWSIYFDTPEIAFEWSKYTNNPKKAKELSNKYDDPKKIILF